MDFSPKSAMFLCLWKSRKGWVDISSADSGGRNSLRRTSVFGCKSGAGVKVSIDRPRLRMSKTGDVVVDFFLGGDFNQLHRTFTPVSDRFRPQARPSLKARFEVLVVEKILLPLHQTKSAGIEIRKSADLKIARIAERSPQLLAPAIEDGEAVGIVHRGTEIVDVNSVVGTEEKHARHRGEPDVIEIHSRIDRHFDVKDGGLTRPYRESIGRRGALAVQ